MIEVAICAGEFFYPDCKEIESFDSILPQIREGFDKLRQVKKADIIDLYQAFSENLLEDPSTSSIEGVAFLSSWLRKANFMQIIEKNLKDIDYLENFIGEKKRIKAQPRGIACHWIAGNVPTLGLFSLFQSMLVGNANLLRVPSKSHDVLVRLLRVFSGTTTENGVSGEDLLKSIALFYFDKADMKANEELSEIADVRIVWGGEAAVKAITGLPRRSHCEDIIFGPKYSLAVFDAAAIASNDFTRYLRFLASDIFLFDQAACTSPHVVFFEKGTRPIEEIGQFLAEEMKKLAKRFPKVDVDQFIMTRIINARAEHALDPESAVICPVENDWTILINKKLQLEDPIESRTIFIKEVDSIEDVIPLITRKVQTIGCAVEDKDKLVAFADGVTRHGVARCVNVGQMHLLDSPWDGMLVLSRLVSWVTLYFGN